MDKYKSKVYMILFRITNEDVFSTNASAVISSSPIRIIDG